MDKDSEKLGLIYERTVSEMAYGMSQGAGAITQEQLVDIIRETESKGTT